MMRPNDNAKLIRRLPGASALRNPFKFAFVLGIAWTLFGIGERSLAQPLPAGVERSMSPEDLQRFQEMRARRGAGRNAGQQPEQPPKEEKPAEEAKEKKEEEKPKEEEAKTVKRDLKPDFKPDPQELKVQPKNGKVQFSFYGQPWKDVLQWYADVANVSFDWQELPEGYVNLTTTRPYTLAETRDILNRQLLARGFTLLKSGELLTAVKIDKLDPSLIPTVDPDELEDYMPYDFVKVRFSLPSSIEPAKANDDVKILLSPQAKVTPLLTTRRLLVIDAVANLRDARDLLYAEQSAVTEDVRPKKFMIVHRRADYVADQIMIVLGLDPASRKEPMELQIEQQRLQLYTQMMQKGQDVTAMLRKDGPPIFVTTDKVRNVVLVNAPPEMMVIIERTIKELDVPDDGGEVANSGRLEMKTYKTATSNTDSLVTALKEIGNLHPLTQLQGDSSKKTIFVYATAGDHEKIDRLLKKLDAKGRGLKVIWLSRRTPALQVAGTIQALMIGTKDEDSNSRRSRYSYYGWGRQEEEPDDDGEFRIQGDVENNRLIMWASDAEHEEVQGLLEKLGVVSSPEAGNPSQVRVLDARSPEETARLLEQLQRAWGGKNRLHIHSPPLPLQDDAPGAKQPEAKPNRADEKEEGELLREGDKLTRTTHSRREGKPFSTLGATSPRPVGILIVDEEGDEIVPGGDQASAVRSSSEEAPPISVTVTPDGRILLNSADAAALDQLEDLMAELAPAENEFEVFHLKNASASMVDLNLRDYFKEELAGQTETVFDEWGNYSGKREKTPGMESLSKRPLLRFIWDIDTNTIVVQNASRSQLATIRKLIDIYDQPVGEDSVARRRTEAIKIKYSNAQDIATSLKEVYRDLLSSKDKEFQGKDGKTAAKVETHYRFFNSGDDAGGSNKKSAPVKMSFEGALSVGVDEVSNSLIISAEENVWTNIRDLVVNLDEAARPDTLVQVHRVGPGVATAQLRQALAEALSQPWPGGKPPGQGGKKSGGSKEDKSKGEAEPKVREEAEAS